MTATTTASTEITTKNTNIKSSSSKNSPSKVTKSSASSSTPTGISSAKYKQLVKQLKQNILKQDKLEDEIDTLEHTIYNQESIYLASTANIIKGFDSYVGSSNTHSHGHGHGHGRDRDHNYSHLNNGISDINNSTTSITSSASSVAAQNAQTAAAAANISVMDSNRIFSLSSATFVKQINNMSKELSKARENNSANN